MNLVDSSGWIEYFTNDVNADFFADIVEDADQLLVSTLNIFEVMRVMTRRYSTVEAQRNLAVMRRGVVAILSEDIALQAVQLSIEHGLAMADSMIVATARTYDAVLWTQDRHFVGLSQVRYIPK